MLAVLGGCGVERGGESSVAAEAALAAVFESFPVPVEGALREHDNLLLAVRGLEALATEHPDHVGIRSDLLWCYVRLLDYEGRSDFGGEICRAAALHLQDATGLDQVLVDRVRSRLHLFAHQYPQAAAAGGEARDILTGLGHDRFVQLPAFEIDGLRGAIHLSVGGPVTDTLIWDALHIDLGPADDASVHRHVAYTLGSIGRGDVRRWYLRFHALNRTMTLRVYGSKRPRLAGVLRHVREHAGDMLAAVKAGVQ